MYENMVINDWPTYIMLSDQLTDQLALDKHTLTLGGLITVEVLLLETWSCNADMIT